MSFFNKLVLLLVLLLVALQEAPGAISARISQGDPGEKVVLPTPPNVVTIYNDLSLELTVHCKSGDNDLGVRYLAPGQNFHWEFHPNVFGTTLYFCGLNSRSAAHGVYDLYKSSRDFHRCEFKCSWHAKPEGLFGYDRSDNNDIKFDWTS